MMIGSNADNTGGSNIADLAERLESAKRSKQLTAADTADHAENRIHYRAEALILDKGAADISANGT